MIVWCNELLSRFLFFSIARKNIEKFTKATSAVAAITALDFQGRFGK